MWIYIAIIYWLILSHHDIHVAAEMNDELYKNANFVVTSLSWKWLVPITIIIIIQQYIKWTDKQEYMKGNGVNYNTMITMISVHSTSNAHISVMLSICSILVKKISFKNYNWFTYWFRHVLGIIQWIFKNFSFGAIKLWVWDLNMVTNLNPWKNAHISVMTWFKSILWLNSCIENVKLNW